MADVIPSSGSGSLPSQNQGTVALGSAMVETQSLDPAMYCMGERCNSVLQLVKRYTKWRDPVTGTIASFFDFRPFVHGGCYSGDTPGTLGPLGGDYVSLITPCYAYSRGSVRVLLSCVSEQPPTSGKGPGVCVIYPSESTTVSQNLNMTTRRGISTNFQPAPGAFSPSGVNVPPYQQLHARLNRVCLNGSIEPVDIYTSRIRACIETLHGAAPANFNVFRAAGDDFTMGYFLGVPLVTTSTSLT